ncbi:tRNA lysidine(34) synthetase TilS [Biformimicrobium ophioploci]|uniref:tRNA(Ile)-lysidine synthase n=1 Tax=Biformimicrobium ophioploci TaxID=3036711 RepID=A0ABQ6LXQ2_9GAMM|nr:tRNA lysidine(34) synthetase TilS [Microbulbifer sp. NKW57]GMG86891.1 tRNA lysidine(34) synthetase TilS [Microbulbifer sp. NKW57]
MNVSAEKVRAEVLSSPFQGTRWVAFSGGLDSSVLLHLLVAAGVPVRAIHVNHGLSPNADAWQAHCSAQAEMLGVPFMARRVTVNPAGGGLEQAAREARHGAFAETLVPGDLLLLGHHADDQAETVLFRLLRGAGVKGLGGMRRSRPLGGGALAQTGVLRPLLEYTRNELEAYARQSGLSWIEDESNADEGLDRNFLRRRVMPLLAGRWPVARALSRAAAHQQEAAVLLDELGQLDLLACGQRAEHLGSSIDFASWDGLSQARRKNLIRHWVQAQDEKAPETVRLEEALRQLCEAGAEASPRVSLGTLELRRYDGRIYLLAPLAELALSDTGWSVPWDGQAPLPLPGGGLLYCQGPPGDYRVQLRRGGERAKPEGRRHSQQLKKLLQEYGLEPWLRDRVPLVYRDDELLAVGDLFVTGVAGRSRFRWLPIAPEGASPD